MYTQFRQRVRVCTVLVPLCLGLAAVAAGCTQTTDLEYQEHVSSYEVGVSISPPTINPPQFSALNFEFTNANDGKPVKAYESTSGALLHNILVSRDLQNFWHSYTDQVTEGRASVRAFFPEYSKYFSYTMFKPAGADVQTITSTVTTGDLEGDPAALVVDPSPVKTEGWLTFELVRQPGEIRVGRPEQMIINVKELGNPVSALWPYFDAPGHLWIVDENGDNFAHEIASAESHPYVLTPWPGLTSTPTPSSRGSLPIPTATKLVVPPSPTYALGVSRALATVNAAPTVALAPVQLTPQSFLQSTPEVLPGVGYGPNLAFTHTFPHAGKYKMWLEVLYRGQVMRVPYVVEAVE